MATLLYLVHRIPYPPNKGDKIRSFHLLRHLAARHQVYLGCFIDDEADHAYVAELERYCAGVKALAIAPRRARLASLSALLTGEALSCAYWRSAELARWVAEVVHRHAIGQAVVFSSAMAQYVLPHAQLRLITDFCDVDSAKFAQYAQEHRGPRAWVYRREARRLLDWEAQVARRSVVSAFATEAESDLFESLAPGVAQHRLAIENGVDTAYFAPAERTSPFDAEVVPLVFTGAMDYWPNIDAVTWFARDVLPRVAEVEPRVRFVVVGMNPSPAVQALAADPRIWVTGKVADVRPFVQHARAVVAPLRVARGIQNKVLEAMALARPVVVSTASAAGLRGRSGEEFAVAEAADEWAARVLELLDPERAEAMGLRARARILADRDWERNLAALDAWLEPVEPTGDAHAR